MSDEDQVASVPGAVDPAGSEERPGARIKLRGGHVVQVEMSADAITQARQIHAEFHQAADLGLKAPIRRWIVHSIDGSMGVRLSLSEVDSIEHINHVGPVDPITKEPVRW